MTKDLHSQRLPEASRNNHLTVESCQGLSLIWVCLFSPHPINFLINYLTPLTRNWLGPLKYLSFHPRVMGSYNFTMFGPNLAHCSFIQEKSCVSPTKVTIEVEYSMDSKEEAIMCQLKNKAIPTMSSLSKNLERLGQNPVDSIGGKGHGRKSHLSKA